MSEIGPQLYPTLPQFSPRPASPIESGAKSPVEGTQSGASFVDSLKSALENVNEMQKSADKASQDFATGKSGTSLHDVMITMEKAEVSLRTLTAVRNKLVESYQEIMRMPV